MASPFNITSSLIEATYAALPIQQPTYTFHGAPSPRPRRCYICKKASCSSTTSPICQNHPCQAKKSYNTSSPHRFGIGGAGNIGLRKASIANHEEIDSHKTSTDEDWLEYKTGEYADWYSAQSVTSVDSCEKSIRHFGIGGAGNVGEGNKISGGSGSSGRSNMGLGKMARRFGIGGAGNVALRRV